MSPLHINNIFVLLTLLFLFVSNGDAEATKPYKNHSQNLTSSRSRTKHGFAQTFTARLKLSSGDGAYIVKHDLLDNESAKILVENPFRFQSLLSDSRSPNVAVLGHNAGYFKLPNTKGHAGIFYFFFEARQNKTTSPVVIWLTGGPGCSSSIALFYENGPFKVLKNLSIVWNNYGWDQAANIIYVDQPIGTGFSYYTDKTDIPTTSEEASGHLYDFLQAFFEKHPDLLRNEFYITGESYAGHYIPAFAARINSENKKKQHLHINLKGISIGDGMTNSGIQYATYRDYAIKVKLINKSQYNELETPVNNCLNEVNNVCAEGTHFNLTACAQAKIDCEVIFDTILDLHPVINYYDIRKNCEGSLCYDFSNMERLLSQASVKKALGVHQRLKFESCSDTVYYAMAGDLMRNLTVYIPELLEDGIKLLLYAGEYDLICDWLGISEWAHEMTWSGQKGFNTSPYVPFKVDSAEAGSQKSFRSLTFLKVHNAGHMVPMDQPKASLEMLRRWIKGLSPL